MKKPPLTVTITPHTSATSFRFSDGGSVYLSPREMREAHRSWRTACFDLSTVVVVSPDSLILSECLGEPPRQSAEFTCEARIYYCDTRKLFAVAETLRTRKLETPTVVDLARLQYRPTEPPKLTLMQIAKHENARFAMARTITHFRRILAPEKWPRLLDELRRILPKAIVFGNEDEFYFDGRKIPNGMGMNGGIIPHGSDFGIHT